MALKSRVIQPAISRLHPSVPFVVLALTFFVGVAIYHILLQPYPNNWDDAWYAIHTYRWLSFIRDRDILRGLFWGYIYMLPGNFPPMVLLTSITGGLINGTLVAMRLAHVAWFVLLLCGVYGIGRKLANGWIGLASVFIVGTLDLVFYWGKTILGEPSLYALIAVTLLMLIEWGDKLTLRRGAAIGLVVGSGFLTKQHYIAALALPFVLWSTWLVVNYYRQRQRGKDILLGLLSLFTIAVIVAGQWYLRHYRETLDYIMVTSRLHFHNLRDVSIGEFLVYYFSELVVEQLGWPAIILVSIGSLWAGYRLIKGFSILTSSWSAMGSALLLSSGITLTILTLVSKNVNTRFLTPALIPLGILSALMLGDWWKQRLVFGRILVIGILIAQFVYWWSQSFSTGLYSLLPVLPQKSFMRPVNIEPLPEAIEFLKSQISENDQERILVVGGSNRFNPPLVLVLAVEAGLNWEIDSLYGLGKAGAASGLERLKEFQWALVYEPVAERQDLFMYFDFDALIYQVDQELSSWLATHPENFELVQKLESKIANNRILIYRILIHDQVDSRRPRQEVFPFTDY